jgi:hypothetical protein
MPEKVATLEEHFVLALTSRQSCRSLAGVLDCLDEDAYRIVRTVAEALRGGNDAESINALILAAGQLLRQAVELIPDWAAEARDAALEAAETTDEAGHHLVRSLTTQCWIETTRLVLSTSEPEDSQ